MIPLIQILFFIAVNVVPADVPSFSIPEAGTNIIQFVRQEDSQQYVRAFPFSSNLTLSVSITNSTFLIGERIVVTGTYSNCSDVVVDIDEGSLWAEFVDKAQNDMFDYAVLVPCRGVRTVSLKPGEEFKDILMLEPHPTIKKGKFIAKISSPIRRGMNPPLKAGEVVFEIR